MDDPENRKYISISNFNQIYVDSSLEYFELRVSD